MFYVLLRPIHMLEIKVSVSTGNVERGVHTYTIKGMRVCVCVDISLYLYRCN